MDHTTTRSNAIIPNHLNVQVQSSTVQYIQIKIEYTVVNLFDESPIISRLYSIFSPAVAKIPKAPQQRLIQRVAVALAGRESYP